MRFQIRELLSVFLLVVVVVWLFLLFSSFVSFCFLRKQDTNYHHKKCTITQIGLIHKIQDFLLIILLLTLICLMAYEIPSIFMSVCVDVLILFRVEKHICCKRNNSAFPYFMFYSLKKEKENSKPPV